jgi:hypothetical protein
MLIYLAPVVSNATRIAIPDIEGLIPDGEAIAQGVPGSRKAAKGAKDAKNIRAQGPNIIFDPLCALCGLALPGIRLAALPPLRETFHGRGDLGGDD